MELITIINEYVTSVNDKSQRTLHQEVMPRGLCERKCSESKGIFHCRGEGFLLRATASRRDCIL